MMSQSRRDFLADVGRGMLVASLGSGLTLELGLSDAFAEETVEKLSFGSIEPLVGLMQDTPLDKLIPALAKQLAEGTELRQLVAAGALANARTFGGQDYIGHHTFMALGPAFAMSKEMPEASRALPVFKVLYRNTNRIHERGGSKVEMLHPVHGEPAETAEKPDDMREATRKADMTEAERRFAKLAKNEIGEAYNHLLFSVQDEVDVHRVVLAWRAWSTIDITGKEYAHTLLRQSVRYCTDNEITRLKQKRPEPGIRALLPKLLDEHKLPGKAAGTKKGDDAWVTQLAEIIYGTNRDQAAAAVAAALAEGMSPESIGEAMSLAANQLVLRDPGRPKAWASDAKPVGSVHGDSPGVHASDSANAWRNISRVSNARNTAASLIVGAYHTAGQSGTFPKESHPMAALLEKVTATESAVLLKEADGAIREKDQARAAAIISKYGQLGHAPKDVFNLLLGFATSEDGALHAEKYYRTVSEEFAAARPAFKWRYLTALARVTASEFGSTAPGYAEAKRVLKV
ncbi:hypothetical protein [Zavarzinella formosa]|uniref:hypothetical protein n=1 Tax=Zavarzinella formosa TaxID=360055 RepID=UPI0005944F96|nr:hypothetical protein [Zavarzinella formosa]